MLTRASHHDVILVLPIQPEDTAMRNQFSRVLSDTRKVLGTRWETRSLAIPPWVINAVIYITLARSVAYGIELFVVTANPVTPMMAFAAIFGLQVWGLLMLIAVVITLAGMLLKNSILVTVGVLLSAAIWTGFGLSLAFGFINLGTGGRFVVTALANAVTWTIFFFVQLKSIRVNGVNA